MRKCIRERSPVSILYIDLPNAGPIMGYIRIVHDRIKYVRSYDFGRDRHKVNNKYYIKILNDVLASICCAFGLSDHDYIVSHAGIITDGL